MQVSGFPGPLKKKNHLCFHFGMGFAVCSSGEVCLLKSHQATPQIPHAHQQKELTSLIYKQKLTLDVHIGCFAGQKRSDYVTLQHTDSDRSWTWNFHWKAYIIFKSHNSHGNIYIWKNYCAAGMPRFWLIQELWVNKTNCCLVSLKQVPSLCFVSAAKNTSKKSKPLYSGIIFCSQIQGLFSTHAKNSPVELFASVRE